MGRVGRATGTPRRPTLIHSPVGRRGVPAARPTLHSRPTPQVCVALPRPATRLTTAADSPARSGRSRSRPAVRIISSVPVPPPAFPHGPLPLPRRRAALRGRAGAGAGVRVRHPRVRLQHRHPAAPPGRTPDGVRPGQTDPVLQHQGERQPEPRPADGPARGRVRRDQRGRILPGTEGRPRRRQGGVRRRRQDRRRDRASPWTNDVYLFDVESEEELHAIGAVAATRSAARRRWRCG